MCLIGMWWDLVAGDGRRNESSRSFESIEPMLLKTIQWFESLEAALAADTCWSEVSDSG